MKNLKSGNEVRLLTTSFFLFFVILLFSCSKNTFEMAQEKAEQTMTNKSSKSRQGNSIVAVPFERSLFVPCANSGAGEELLLTGKTNFVYQMSWSKHRFTMVYHDNVHDVTGVGLYTGDQFAMSGGTNGTVMGSFVNSQWIGTTIQQLKVVGRNSSFIVIYKYHIVVTSDGNVVVKSKEETAECGKAN